MLFFTAVSFSLCVELTQFFSLFMGCQCINDLVQIAVHDLIQIVDRQANAVVSAAILREVVSPDPL